MKNDDQIVLDDNLEDVNNFCEECKKEDVSVKQNLIMHGYKICKSCNLYSQTLRTSYFFNLYIS